MTPEQIAHARHALGFQGGDNKRSYRNRYYVAPGCEVHARWMDMVKNGWAECYPAEGQKSGDLFCLTHIGAKLALKRGETLCPEDFPVTCDSTRHRPYALDGEGRRWLLDGSGEAA